MKNKIILSLVAIIFLSSCASKFSLNKRRYTKGYYFASSKSTNSLKKENSNGTALKKLTVAKTTLPQQEISSAEIVQAEPISFLQPEILKEKKQASAQKFSGQKITASAQAKVPMVVKPVIKAVKEKQNVNYTHSKTSDADTKLILMVILCFFPFINLIPVYIHDGKKVTLNFILTLILDFTWVLGVVYALLVVLDVIDLK